jgi:hypothetical protein
MSSHLIRPVALVVTLLTTILLLPGLAGAQFSGADTLYAGGAVGFTYRQTPFPIYSGEFAVAGDALLPDGGWNPGQTAAVGGGMGLVTADSVATVVYAIQDNGNDTYDVSLTVVRTFGVLQPGTFSVDVQTGTALFVFIDDAATVALPDTLDAPSVIQWFQDLPAAHKFVSLSGTITVSTVSADTLAATFQGTAADIDNVFLLINVSDGHLELRGRDPLLATIGEPPFAPAMLTVTPNPFNPRTTITFDLAQAQAVAADIYDLAGRRVRALHRGDLGAGRQRFDWDGTDDGAVRLGAGVYLVRVSGSNWSQATKLTLLP